MQTIRRVEKLASPETRTSDVKFVRAKPGGRLETCCLGVNLPSATSYSYSMTVDPFFLQRVHPSSIPMKREVARTIRPRHEPIGANEEMGAATQASPVNDPGLLG